MNHLLCANYHSIYYNYLWKFRKKALPKSFSINMKETNNVSYL